MAHQLEIIPEDGAMRILVQTLGFHRPNHANGISDTLSKIENHFKNRFAIGIVDDDKRKPKLFDQYHVLLKEQFYLQLRQKENSLHFLITLHPAVEDWLLENARLKDIKLKKFQTRQDLMRITKDEIEVARNPQFKQFLNDLKQADAPGFVTMAAWIKELREKHVW